MRILSEKSLFDRVLEFVGPREAVRGLTLVNKQLCAYVKVNGDLWRKVCGEMYPFAASYTRSCFDGWVRLEVLRESMLAFKGEREALHRSASTSTTRPLPAATARDENGTTSQSASDEDAPEVDILIVVRKGDCALGTPIWWAKAPLKWERSPDMGNCTRLVSIPAMDGYLDGKYDEDEPAFVDVFVLSGKPDSKILIPGPRFLFTADDSGSWGASDEIRNGSSAYSGDAGASEVTPGTLPDAIVTNSEDDGSLECKRLRNNRSRTETGVISGPRMLVHGFWFSFALYREVDWENATIAEISLYVEPSPLNATSRALLASTVSDAIDGARVTFYAVAKALCNPHIERCDDLTVLSPTIMA